MLNNKTIMLLITTALLASGCGARKTMEPARVVPSILESEAALALDFEKNVGDRVFFSFDSSQLSQKTKKHLKKQVTWLLEHPGIGVSIEGHCDERGGEEYNLGLGHRRAEAIEKFLLEHGIASSRIEIVTYGKDRPAVFGHKEGAWKQNRRGVMFVTIKAGQTDRLHE